MKQRFVMNLQRFAEEGQTVTIGDQEYTVDQLADRLKSYEKLEKQHTKVSQEKSELEKRAADLQKFADEWGVLAEQVASNPSLAAGFQEVYSNFANGTLTQKDVNTFQKALNTAKADGDTDAVKELREQLNEVRGQLAEQGIRETIDSIAAQAKEDDIDGFTLDGFKEFADKWLEEELDIGDDDEVTPKHIKQAYTAYESHLLKEQIKRERTPSLSSNAGASTPTASAKQEGAPKGLKARHAARMEQLKAERANRR